MDEEQKHLMTEKNVSVAQKRPPFIHTLPWIISTAGFAILSAIFYWKSETHHNYLGTYEKGFATDFGMYDFSSRDISQTEKHITA